MKAIATLVTLAAAAAAEVINLTPSNFDEVVNGDKHVLVKFFAPWCGHCKAMAEDYITASDAFAKFPEVVIAEVDADAHKDLKERFGVTGFPKLKWFPKGSTTAEDYTAGRGVDDVITFVNSKAKTRAFVAKPASDVVVLTPSNFKTYMDKDAGMLLEFYAPWCGHCKKLAPIYEKVATTFVNEESVIVANVDADAHKSLGEPYGVTGFPTLKWIPADCHDAACAVDYSGLREGEAIVDFINDKMSTKRILGGRLSEDAGRYAHLDFLVPEFMTATDKQAIIDKAEEMVEEYPDSGFYVKVMKKIVKLADSSEEWIQNEVSRLTAMLDKSMTATKKDDFNKRLNIIKQFHSEL